MPAEVDPAVADLREVLDLGLAHGGELLTAGEALVLRRLRAIDGPAASLYARLSARKPSVFHVPSLTVRRVPDLQAAIAVLEDQGLADGLVPWSERAKHLRMPQLIEGCRRKGLPTSGRRSALVERLSPHAGYCEGRWVRIRHKALVARMERLAFLVPWPDRATLVLARIGVTRWPTYEITSGAASFRDRRAMVAWEALLSENTPEEALAALARGDAQGAAGLDLSRSLVSSLRERCDALLKRRDEASLDEAIIWLTRLAEGGHGGTASHLIALSKALERKGLHADAFARLQAALPVARPSEAVAARRSGRRLAKRLKRGFPPARPLDPPRQRDLKLELVEGKEGRRPLWRGADGRALEIEPAVVSKLAEHGCRALYGEGAPWSTLVAVLCADLLLMKVPGALPARFLSGPLDLGTPSFRARRAEAFDALLAAIDEGRAPEIVARNDARHRGARLVGARWDSADEETLLALACAMPPRGLRCLVEALLTAGMGAASGLPDLAVFPGERVRLPFAWPGFLPKTLLLAEIKGPGDTVRDAQRIWHDRLLKAGVCVELWQVSS